MTDDLVTAIVEFQRDAALQLVDEKLAGGVEPLAILEMGRHGMALVGEKFQNGEYYLAELILASEVFKRIAERLRPYLESTESHSNKGKIILATLRGDIHDLGKNILATLLRAHGFEVHDLGVDVEPEVLVEAVREVKPDFVGFSALITTAFTSMKETVELLVQANLRSGVMLMIGGGVTTPALKDHIGADFQSNDAMAGIRYCLEHMSHKGDGHAQ